MMDPSNTAPLSSNDSTSSPLSSPPSTPVPPTASERPNPHPAPPPPVLPPHSNTDSAIQTLLRRTRSLGPLTSQAAREVEQEINRIWAASAPAEMRPHAFALRELNGLIVAARTRAEGADVRPVDVELRAAMMRSADADVGSVEGSVEVAEGEIGLGGRRNAVSGPSPAPGERGPETEVGDGIERRMDALAGPSSASGERGSGRGGGDGDASGRGWNGRLRSARGNPPRRGEGLGRARYDVGGRGRGSARGQSPITGLWRGGGDFVVTELGRGRGRGRGWGQEIPESHPWPRLHEQVPGPTTAPLERIEDPTQSDDEMSSGEIYLVEDVVYLPVDVGSAFPGRRVCPRRLCKSDQDGWEREEDAEDMEELNEGLGDRVQLTPQAREELEEVTGLRVPADGVVYVARDGSGSS